MQKRPSWVGLLAGVWGIGGVIGLLSFAIYRLTPLALEAAQGSLATSHKIAFVVSIVLFAYTEGYKAFQKAFSPRVVARALHLMTDPKPLHVLLAPPFCMGLIHATSRRLIASWSVTLGVVVLVLLVSSMSQPWRGIVDAGVIVALAWGIVAILGFAARGLSGGALPVSPDLPSSDAPMPEALESA